jgi:hypothetical protein
MSAIRVSASAVVDAPPGVVYSVLADYRTGHPSILPPRTFRDFEVQRGGTGAGTVISFSMRVLGRTRTFRAEVTEPEPGRTLVESYPGSGEVTTFTVDPAGAGRSSVTITTEWAARGLAGLVQRLLAPPVLRRVYAEELRNLARVASARAGAGPAP